jgi:arylmalonate decarboxylase
VAESTAHAAKEALVILSRRELLQSGVALGLGTAAAAAQTLPLLGIVAPPANYPVPPEGVTLYSHALRFAVHGLGLKTMTPAGYDSVIDQIVPAAAGLAKQGADGIVIFGTSLTFYRGAAFNQRLIDDVRKATGLDATSMSTAVVDGLKLVNARRLAVATAYNDEVNRRLGTFLTESGFQVLAMKGLGLEAIGAAEKVSQADLQKFCADVYQGATRADALLVSCGGLRTLELIAPLERECRVPVVSSTPHALWAGMRLLGLRVKTPAYGHVLANG